MGCGVLSAWISLSICLVSAMAASVEVLRFTQAGPTPPTFPDAFTIDFSEIQHLFGELYSKNNGTWHYDWTNRRARFDHNRGQHNNFCGRQHLSPHDPKADCQLFFTPAEDLIVYYPGAKSCCRLCGKKEGCTILRPDWLKMGSKLLSVEEINGNKCYGWGKPGAVAFADTWFATADGMPCRYHEIVFFVHHNLTFVPESYKMGPPDPSIFEVPSYCATKKCPHPFHNWGF